MPSNTPSDFINPAIYQTSSLEEITDQLSNPKVPVSMQAIINFVVKYLYAYRHPLSFSEKIPLKDIQYIIEQ